MKKTMSLLLIVVLITSLITNASTVFADTEGIASKKIEELIETRTKLVLQIPNDVEAIDQIDSKLKQLGADILEPSEVQAMFSKPANKALRVSVPSSTKNDWISYRTKNVAYNGKKYNIQTLVATPKSTSSPLSNIGSQITTFNYNWKAGATNVIKSVGMTAAGAIPGSTIAVGFYDAVSSFVSGIQKTTLVTAPHITYTWSTATYVTFEYARLEGASDSTQKLTYIHTKVIGESSYAIPTLSYKNAAGKWQVAGSVDTGKSQIYVYPTPVVASYPSLYGYVNNTVVNERVSSYNIYGPASETDKTEKLIKKIYPIMPNFPAHCG